MKKTMPEIEEEKYKKAVILVGGIVTTGEKGAKAKGERTGLQKEKVNKVKECLEIIQEKTPVTFEKTEFMIGTYTITKMTYGCGAPCNKTENWQRQYIMH